MSGLVLIGIIRYVWPGLPGLLSLALFFPPLMLAALPEFLIEWVYGEFHIPMYAYEWRYNQFLLPTNPVGIS